MPNLFCRPNTELYSLTSVRRKRRKKIQPRIHTKQHEAELSVRAVSCGFVVKFFISMIIITADIEPTFFNLVITSHGRLTHLFFPSQCLFVDFQRQLRRPLPGEPGSAFLSGERKTATHILITN